MSNITLILISILCISLAVAFGFAIISKQMTLLSKQLSLLINSNIILAEYLKAIRDK